MSRSTEPFSSRIARLSMPITETGCWIWLGSTDYQGYGRTKLHHHTYRRAHRLSWIEHFGSIPDGLYVLHRCDVPACINPDHLFLGSHADNMADRKRKGRYIDQARNFRSSKIIGSK